MTLFIGNPEPFAAWRTVARSLVMEGIAPEDVLWKESSAAATVPETAACHRAPDRWPFLYKVLWRWTQGDRAVASPEARA